MKNIEENNLVRFINVSKKKDGLFANFKVKGIRGGVIFSASVAVDLSEAMNIDPSSSSLEQIVEECAKIAVRELKKIDFQFEPLTAL